MLGVTLVMFFKERRMSVEGDILNVVSKGLFGRKEENFQLKDSS